MKKLTKLLSALAALMLTLASCDEPDEGNSSPPPAVPEGSAISAVYTQESGGLRVEFSEDGSVTLYEGETQCATGTYTVGKDGTATITVTNAGEQTWGGKQMTEGGTLTVEFSSDGMSITVSAGGASVGAFTTERKPEVTDKDDGKGEEAPQTTGVPKGSYIVAEYSQIGGAMRIKFDNFWRIELYDDNYSDDGDYAYGWYTVTSDNTASITITDADTYADSAWGNLKSGDTIAVQFTENNLTAYVNGQTHLFSSEETPKATIPAFTAEKGKSFDTSYSYKYTIALYEGGKAVLSLGNLFETTTYQQDGDSITIKIGDSILLKGTISGDSMSVRYVYSDGDDDEVMTFNKKGTKSDPDALSEWEEYTLPRTVRFETNGTVGFYENNELCWRGTYTVPRDNYAETHDVAAVNGKTWLSENLNDKQHYPHGALVTFDFCDAALVVDVEGLDEAGDVRSGHAITLTQD